MQKLATKEADKITSITLREFKPFKPVPLVDYSDQRAVLDTKPLRGLRPVHECGGLYVIVRECPHAPDNYEIIAENLTAEHARQICEAVNEGNGV